MLRVVSNPVVVLRITVRVSRLVLARLRFVNDIPAAGVTMSDVPGRPEGYVLVT